MAEAARMREEAGTLFESEVSLMSDIALLCDLAAMGAKSAAEYENGGKLLFQVLWSWCPFRVTRPLTSNETCLFVT